MPCSINWVSFELSSGRNDRWFNHWFLLFYLSPTWQAEPSREDGVVELDRKFGSFRLTWSTLGIWSFHPKHADQCKKLPTRRYSTRLVTTYRTNDFFLPSLLLPYFIWLFTLFLRGIIAMPEYLKIFQLLYRCPENILLFDLLKCLLVDLLFFKF